MAEVERYGSGEYLAWYNLVKPHGQWDFKAHPRDHPGVSDADLDYTGNFNYAATGALLQIPENVLLAAGASKDDPPGSGHEAGGSGNHGFFGIGGTWPFGEKLTDAQVEHDGYMYAFWLHGFNIDLCPKKKRRRC